MAKNDDRGKGSNEVFKALDFFVAGVPPLGYFELEVKGLSQLVGRSRVSHGLNQTAEVCFIALAAYFEAFCKAQFAGIINVCPKVLRNFIKVRKEANIQLRNVLEVLGDVKTKLGSVLAEQYDFGSAKAVNGLYQDLLGITPFSRAEKKRYDEFLDDRNLLVHHGGIYTLGYAARRFATRTAPGLPHWSSLVVSARDYRRWATFLLEMGEKIAGSSKTALEKYIGVQKITLTAAQRRAIDFFRSSGH
jgi:hypothetical protein